jgi:Lamin Tail Domain
MRRGGFPRPKGSAMKRMSIGAAALAVALSGCANEAPKSSSQDFSDLSMRLTLPDGEAISSVSYTVTGGPSAITRMDTVDVEDSSIVRFQVGDLPVGPGYAINLSAVTEHGASCAGSSPFAILINQVTVLSMPMSCGSGSTNDVDDAGDLRVNVTVQEGVSLACPVVTGISALPAEVRLGNSLQVEGFSSSASDSVTWSAPSGTFASTSAASTTYTCAAAGDIALTFSIQKAGCPAAQYAATVTCTAPNPRGLVWNEIESNGGTPDDWTELYNTSSQPVDLTGWTFRDNDNTHIYAIPAGTTVAPGGYAVLENYGFGLGSPDAARLYDAEGVLVLSYDWGPHAATTYGRCPNATGALTTTSSSTKGAANDCTPVLRINEIESNGGSPDDWIEIINAGLNTADLTGWTLKDNVDNDPTHVYTFPAGSTLVPGAYLAVDVAATFGLGAGDSARLFNPTGTLVDSYVWTAHAATTYGRCPDQSGPFATTAAPTKGTANSCATASADIRINEVESTDGIPGDWVELYNSGTTSVSVGGWTFRDNNNANGYVLPAGTSIAAGGYLVLDETANFTFGLGGADSVRIFNPGGTLVDSYTWSTAATTTYGRCPNGTGDFATTVTITKGTANDCGGAVVSAWLGATEVQTVDPANAYPSNLSGLHYQPANGAAPAVLWGALNGPGKLYRLIQSGTQWLSDSGAWLNGKILTYGDGSGEPDSEGVTKAAWDVPGIYVSTERNNQVSGTSRLSVLRFDETQTGTSLAATNEWNLTSQLPAVGANAGLEAIAWLPDAYLVAHGFRDALLNKVYAPADYANHGTGLFAVGVEGTGNVHVLALNHSTNTASILATFSGQQASVMDLEFDRDQGVLWVACDDTCGNQITLFAIDELTASATRGQFILRKRLAPPSGLPLSNHEGFTFQSNAECTGGQKAVFWCDDSNLASHALRQGSMSCSPQF